MQSRAMHEGMPDRMDGDGSGIPSETPYDQVEINTWIEFDRVWWMPGNPTSSDLPPLQRGVTPP